MPPTAFPDVPAERMREAAGAHYATATDLANTWCAGPAFREAHEGGGARGPPRVDHARERLTCLFLEELRRLSP